VQYPRAATVPAHERTVADGMSVQALIIVAAGIGLLLSSVLLVRRQLLSIRYGLGWIGVAVLAILGAPVFDQGWRHVDGLGITPTGFSLGVVIAFLGLICLQLSISLSGVQRQMQDIAEHAAHVEERVKRLESANGAARQQDRELIR
jgi:hypothetical protein